MVVLQAVGPRSIQLLASDMGHVFALISCLGELPSSAHAVGRLGGQARQALAACQQLRNTGCGVHRGFA